MSADRSMDYQSQFRRLEELRHQLLDRIRAVDHSHLHRAPSDGGWSAARTLAHIVEAENKSLGYVRTKIQDPDAIPRRGFRQQLNGLLLAAAMKSPFKFEVPPSVGEPPASVDLDDLTREWEETRDGWRELIAGFPPALAARTVYRHPVAGPLTLGQALTFLIAHLERHSRQIDRALG